MNEEGATGGLFGSKGSGFNGSLTPVGSVGKAMESLKDGSHRSPLVVPIPSRVPWHQCESLDPSKMGGMLHVDASVLPWTKR